MDEPTKRCPRCGLDKPWSAYNLRTTERYTDNGAPSNQLGKPHTYCRACNTEYARALRAKRQADRAARPATTYRY